MITFLQILNPDGILKDFETVFITNVKSNRDCS
jgi:hypothetical protein